MWRVFCIGDQLYTLGGPSLGRGVPGRAYPAMDIRQHKAERPDGLGVWRAGVKRLIDGLQQLLDGVPRIEKLVHLPAFALRGLLLPEVCRVRAGFSCCESGQNNRDLI